MIMILIEMIKVNLKVIIIFIAIFVNTSQNQDYPEFTYPNIFIYGNNNSIKLVYSPSPEHTQVGIGPKEYGPNKNIAQFIRSLQQNLIQLAYNTTIDVLQANYNGINSENSQRRISETPNLVHSMVSNRNLKDQSLESAEDEEEEPQFDDINEKEQIFYESDEVSTGQNTQAPGEVSQEETSYISDLDNTECGTSSVPINTLIDDGNIKPGTWPWWSPVYTLTSDKSLIYKCGGTLIASNIVLSAANCFFSSLVGNIPSKIAEFRVGLGVIGRNYVNEPNTFIAEIDDIIIHPSYSGSKSFDGDIAIITLKKSYFYSDRIRPACLWTIKINQKDIGKQDAYVASFVKENKLALNIFKTGIISSDTCLSKDSNPIKISKRNFCADYVNGQGPCYGNTGQGLFIEENGKFYLRGIVVGIVASAYTLCDLNEHGIYTDVSKFIQWIDKYIKKPN